MLYVIATPIGNLEDMSYRAVRVLGEVQALACEDTRRTRRILERYTISVPGLLFSYHEHNEWRAGRKIIKLLEQDRDVALCTNAGYPGISDPGYRIIAGVRDLGMEVNVLPGAGAVATALVSSGLPSASYIFKGFLPKKRGPRRRMLALDGNSPHTIVLFESPHRVGALLADSLDVLGDRMASVCIELTKKFEEVHRGYLGELESKFREVRVKGEITVVVAGNSPKFIRDQQS